MSHRSLSPQQFSGQLKMFMTPDEIIDTAHKGDSALPWRQGRLDTKPREEWEHPDSGSSYGGSLRDEKLHALDHDEDESFDAFRTEPWDTAPPVSLYHMSRWAGDEPRTILRNGHHRLAHAERAGIPYMAVTHQEWPVKK